MAAATLSRRRQSLDGEWEIRLEPGAPFVPIRVPFTFEAPLSGIGAPDEIHERVVYRRSFDWDGTRALLHFGAVDWRAHVSVDGRDVGGHTGGYTHFTLDLGDLRRGEHELVVEVEDPAHGRQPKGKQRGSHGIWYTRATGIWQAVWLESVPRVHITRFELTPHLDGRIEARVETSEPVDVRVEPERVDRPRLWSPDDPFLYDVTMRAGEDELATYVGFRSIETRGREVLLNGAPIVLRGVLDQGYWPDGVYSAPSGDALRADVEAAKTMGFNLARKHVKIEDPRWYEECDRLGLLVAQDMPSSRDLSTPEARAGFLAEWTEAIGQLCGHPSILLWIPFNEHWGEPPPDFQRQVVRATRAADPSRLVIDASGWNQLEDTDLVDVHDYGADLSRHRSADRPTWLGECGGISLAPGAFAHRTVAGPGELAAEYARLVGSLDGLAGFVWTQLTDVEGELNGLLTCERIPKVPPETMRAINGRGAA
jgi:beta-galactosidase/beta-glucuronidase